MIETWRLWAIVIILILSFADLALTYYYVHAYKEWQPDKPYKLIELNPLLRFLWNTFGFHLGMFIGFVVMLSLNYIIIRYAHWSIVLVLFLVLLFTMVNHFNNLNLLGELIKRYPTGHLPSETFGVVEGNN